MTDYDMSVYDEMKPSINQYINLLAEFNKRLVNIKNNKIPIETRKKKAFELVLKEVVKLDGEELQKWKDKLENVFNPKKAEKVKNNLKVEADFTGKVFTIGEKEFIDNDFDPRTFSIQKITKCYIFWTELDTNCWNNNHKTFRKKKKFCDVRNCEYFEDNINGVIYADGTYI